MSETTYLLTGATGLLGQCVLYELLAQHAGSLERVRIFCLGRGDRDRPLAQRLEGDFLGASGAHLDGRVALEGFREAVKPIHAAMETERLGLSDEDVAQLTRGRIDHVIHLAALTDFRRKESVEARLRETNVEGTRRLIDLVDAFETAPESFNFVSSAYSCGETYGTISPDYVNLDQRFQNPYQRCKLEAELLLRGRLEAGSTALRVFRPTVLAGRLDHAPQGYVSKYDVYLGWAIFFLHVKREILGAASWEALMGEWLHAPIRFAANPELGLNIVPADFVAELIVAAIANEFLPGSMHVAAGTDLQNYAMMERMLEVVGVEGHSYVRGVPDDRNPLEDSYYRSAGGLYTPYIDLDEPWRFELDAMLELCRTAGLRPKAISKLEDFDVMLHYAREQHWGLSI